MILIANVRWLTSFLAFIKIHCSQTRYHLPKSSPSLHCFWTDQAYITYTLSWFWSQLISHKVLILDMSLTLLFKRPRAFKARPLLSLTFIHLHHLHLHHFNDFSKWLNSPPKGPQKSPKAPPRQLRA